MPATVLLKDILDALEILSDEASSLVDLDTGKVETVTMDLLSKAENWEDGDKEPNLSEWQKPEWEVVKRIVSTDSFRKLPTKYDVHEWEIMRDFADAAGSDEIREELLDLIHGAGAFRNFQSLAAATPPRIGLV